MPAPDWCWMTAALDLWIVFCGHGKIYMILLASKGSQILFHVKWGPEQLINLFFCFWVFCCPVVELIWFLLSKDGQFFCLKLSLFALSADSPHPSSKMVSFMLEEQGYIPAKMGGSTKWPSGLITSNIQITPVTDFELGRWLFMPAGLKIDWLLFFIDGSISENESLICTRWPHPYFKEILGIALRILQVGQSPFPMQNLRQNCWFPFFYSSFVQYQKIMTDKLQSSLFLEFLCS